MIRSFHFEIYQLEKGQPSWTNCALRRPAPLNCFSSIEFPQDLVFVSLIPDCFFMNWVVASLQFTFLVFCVFSSWLLFGDLSVLLHYSHPCVSFPQAASFPLFLLSPQVPRFPSVLGRHTHHRTAVTTAPLTASLLLMPINRIKFLSQYSPALNAGRMPRTQPVRKPLHLCVCHRHDEDGKVRTSSSPGTTHVRPRLIQLDRDEVTTAGVVIQSHNTLQRIGLMHSVAHHHHIQLILVVHFMDCLTANRSRRISNEAA